MRKTAALVMSALWGAAPVGASSSIESLKSEAFGLRAAGADAPPIESAGPASIKGTFQIQQYIDPPVHRWLVYQARSIWSTPEIDSFMPLEWPGGDSPIMRGADLEDTESDSSQFRGCWMSRSYCNHYWDPKKGDAGGLWLVRQWDAAPVRAQKLWDRRVLPAYRRGDKEEAYLWLGRVAHLLADMSVPAHTHLDIHLNTDAFENYVAESGNYRQWTGSGEPVEASSLRELFLSLAELANDFDSNDAAGELPENSLGHSGAWETHGGVYRYYRVSYAEAKRQGDVLMPAAMRHIAGLFKLFWKTVAARP